MVLNLIVVLLLGWGINTWSRDRGLKGVSEALCREGWLGRYYYGFGVVYVVDSQRYDGERVSLVTCFEEFTDGLKCKSMILVSIGDSTSLRDLSDIECFISTDGWISGYLIGGLDKDCDDWLHFSKQHPDYTAIITCFKALNSN